MPDAAPPDPITESWWTANGRQQVISQLTAASLPAAATEGRVYAVTDRDRLEFDTGSLLLPGPNWGSAGRVGFRLTDATNRSIPNGTGTFTALTFATEATDTDGFIAAPGTTVTIPSNRGGIYVGYATWTWASNPGANSAAQLTYSGTPVIRCVNSGATQSTVASLIIAGIGIDAGVTLEIQLSQGSGGAINVNPSTWQMWRICA